MTSSTQPLGQPHFINVFGSFVGKPFEITNFYHLAHFSSNEASKFASYRDNIDLGGAEMDATGFKQTVR